MNRAYVFISPAQIPQANGSIAPDAVQIPGVTALTARVVPALAGAQVVEGEFVEGIFEPTAEDLAWLAGRRYRLCGWVRHRLHLPPRKGLPVVFFAYGPCYEVSEEDGDLWYRWAPLPKGFDPDLRIHEELDAMIIEGLGHHAIESCARWTLVPTRTIEIIRDCLGSWQRDAMRAGDARPQQVAVTKVSLPGRAGARHEALHLVAGEPETGRAWTLALLDQALGAEDLAACLAEELANLPHPAAVQTVLTAGDHATRAVVREALAMTPSGAPGFAAKMVVEGRGDLGSRQVDPFVGAVAQLDRSLEALAREALLTVEHLEKRALVRQGYEAALRWPLVLPTLGGGWAEEIRGPSAPLRRRGLRPCPSAAE